MLACACGLLQLRLLQRVVQLHQQLAATHALAVAEAERGDAPADLGPQHHALARTQRAHGLRVVFQRHALDLADLDAGRPAGARASPGRGAWHSRRRCGAGGAAGARLALGRFCHHHAAHAPATAMPSTATQVCTFFNVCAFCAMAHCSVLARSAACGRRAQAPAPGTPRLAKASARSLPGSPAWRLDPVPAHLVLLRQRVQPLPQVDVLHRLVVGGLPAARLPAVDPGADAVAQVLAVGVDGRRHRPASARPGPRSARSAPCGCWWSARSPPHSSFACPPDFSQAPQPPGPGLPLQAPSV